MRWTEEDLSRLRLARGERSGGIADSQSKYRNVPVRIDGERFDSKREARRWGELKLLEQAGEISLLKRQVKYRIEVQSQHVCDYIADFTYMDHRGQYGDQFVVEDSKGAKTAIYRLKKKLMRALYGLEILET